MTIITIANSKGGVGKSTTAVHLAAWLHDRGQRVTLADCDPQRSSSQWIAEACPDVRAVRMSSPDQILDELLRLAEEADFVVADRPGSQFETSRALLLRADFAVIPYKARMLEMRALAEKTNVLQQARDVRGGPPSALIVLNMVGKNYGLTADMREAALALKLPIAKTPWVLRQIYADAPEQGAVVSGLGTRGRVAATEVDKIFVEVFAGTPYDMSKAKKPRQGAA